MSAPPSAIEKICRSLWSKPLRWYFLTLVLAAAGPFAVEIVFLIDVVSIIGFDALLISIALYYSTALMQACAVFASLSRAMLLRCGCMLPSREERFSPETLSYYCGHNVCALGTPIIFVVAAAGSIVCLVSMIAGNP